MDGNKIKKAAIITVRTSSKRLHSKCFKKLTKELSMIEIIVRRAKKIGCNVIIATSTDESDDRLVDFIKLEDVKIFRGSLLNKIHRWYSCFDFYNLDIAMLVDADDPSFSYSVQKRALFMLENENTELVKSNNLMISIIKGANPPTTIIKNIYLYL